MKKTIFLFFIFVGSFFLVSCGGVSSESLGDPHTSEGEVDTDIADTEEEALIHVVELQTPDTKGERRGLNLSDRDPNSGEGSGVIVVDQQSGVVVNNESISEIGQKVIIGVDPETGQVEVKTEQEPGVVSDSEAVEPGPKPDVKVDTEVVELEPKPDVKVDTEVVELEPKPDAEVDAEAVEPEPEVEEKVGPERARYVCRKGNEERTYILYRPGVSKQYLCEIDLIIGGQENRNTADWRAVNQADFCEKELAKIIDRHTTEEGYTCFEN